MPLVIQIYLFKHNKPTLNHALHWILRLILQCLKHSDRNCKIPDAITNENELEQY